MANCPYCKKYFSTKKPAIDHILSCHPDRLEADNMDASQALYFDTHGTLHGKCQCGCKTPTEWNYKTGKPYRVSPDPKCRKRISDSADKNMMKAHGTTTLLTNMEHQRMMQRGRKTAGAYKFADGGSVEFLSKEEENFLRFCDTVMEFTSNMILEPTETFTYTDTKTNTIRSYMVDYYLPDYNLLVEIKDGGDRKNTNPAYEEETGYKVKLKDKAMQDQTKYNFIRVSGRNYGAFLDTLYKIVHEPELSDNKKRKNLVVITEAACLADEIEERMLGTVETEAVGKYVHLMVGTSYNTPTMTVLGITDSRTLSYWYVSNYTNRTLSRVSSTDSMFDNISYRIYRYVGNRDKIVDGYKFVENCVETGVVKELYTDILNMLYDSADVCFDNSRVANNSGRRMEFVEVSKYTWNGGNGNAV